MPDRRQVLSDAAIRVLGDRGARGLTHRAVDAEAGLPTGSTANHFSTREALLAAIVERVSARERDHVESLAAGSRPSTATGLGRVLGRYAVDATGVHRSLTLSRYAILVESGSNPGVRRQVAATGSRVSDWFATWLQAIGSADPPRDVHVVGNYLTGLILHELALPAARFDPTPGITRLLVALTGVGAAGPDARAVCRSRNAGRS